MFKWNQNRKLNVANVFTEEHQSPTSVDLTVHDYRCILFYPKDTVMKQVYIKQS